MALNNDNNNECCKCTTPEYELILNEQGPQGRQGEKGDAGFTPIISVKDNTPSNYTLNILTQDGQITTPNLKANLPAGGATGQVLTKNSGEQDDCSWQNLPASTIETEGIARLATEADFETTEDTEASDNTIVTPALFNSEFEKQSANFVTTDTQQDITGIKTFTNNVSANSGVYSGNNTFPLIVPDNSSTGSIQVRVGSSDYSNISLIKLNAKTVRVQSDNIQYRDSSTTDYDIMTGKNLSEYIIAGDNITTSTDNTGKITISSTGGGGTITYIDGGNAQTDEQAVLSVSNVDLGIYPTNNIYSTNEDITIE